MSVELRAAARGIHPERFQAYLRDRGWRLEEDLSDEQGIVLWARDGLKLDVPLRTQFRDYERRMAEALAIVAEVEGIDPFALAGELLQPAGGGVMDDEWERQIEHVRAAPEWGWDHAEDEALLLVGLARIRAGVGCPECSATGMRTYGSTSGWRGGGGGQAITRGVCDRCWGTGRTDVTGPDLRAIARELKRRRPPGMVPGAGE